MELFCSNAMYCEPGSYRPNAQKACVFRNCHVTRTIAPALYDLLDDMVTRDRRPKGSVHRESAPMVDDFTNCLYSSLRYPFI
jgi:hypothetical protein